MSAKKKSAGGVGKLAFKATRVTAEIEGPTLMFEVEKEGDAEIFFGLVATTTGLLISWSDGKTTVEDCAIAVANHTLEKQAFKLDYKDTDPAKVGPYKGVELTFEALDEDTQPDVAEAFAKLFTAAPVKKELPPPSASARRRGSPQLGVLAATRDEWRAKVGEEATFEISVSNGGGGVTGINLEIGGPALASGNIEVREAKAQGKSAKVETKAGVARVVLEHVKVDADLDVDRKALGREAPPLPKFPFSLVVKGKTAGQALLTVRVIPRTPDGRGAAMVGRTIFVDA